MSTEAHTPVVLRTVKHEPDEAPKAPLQTGIEFECPTQTKCPHCKTVVPLAGATPLTHLTCPTCGGQVFVPGRVGGFLLYEHIGEGEMGAIYRATDESLFRDVAIKLVRGCLANDRESRERLRREACAAGQVNHPRVAQVHALNFSNGHPYLVMELVTGEDFAQRLASEKRIDERAVLRMALDVAEGLSALNREGLIHGDIKPGNIVLDRDGNAKLVDFGLSGMTRYDSCGNFVGTPDYIAPELLRGSPDSHRSDLFSLGATLYHLLSGRPPYEGDTAEEVLKARVLRPAVPLGKVAYGISAPTQKLVMRMLELHPAKRPLNSEVVADEIRDALVRLDARHAAAAETPPSAWHRLSERFHLPRWSIPEPRRRAVVTGGLALIALINLLIAVEQRSFEQTFAWIRQGIESARAAPDEAETPPPAAEAAGPAAAVPKGDSYVKVVAPGAAAKSGKPAPAALGKPAPLPHRPDPAAPAAEAAFAWQSTNLGGEKTSGSTLQVGDTLIVQGTGTDLWKGYDRCRFVWTKAAGDFTFSTQVKAIAASDGAAVSGLLVKGEDPARGPGLLFGFLGTGELFLQLRHPDNQTALVKRSGGPEPLPRFLRLVRAGNSYEASVSADGRAWQLFAACQLALAPTNALGFCVSSQDADTLAAATFAHIFLLEPDLPGGPRTNKLSAGARPPTRPARRW